MSAGHARDIVTRDPEVHSGALVFTGTRVPVATLTDHLSEGGTVAGFLAGYPSVAESQVRALLDLMVRALTALDDASAG